MAFKLRSGNSPMFNRVGEEKETNAQYNARVKAEHEAKLQSYNDSTASYKNQVEIDNIQTYLENDVTEYDARLAATKDTLTSAEHEELVSSHNKQMDKGEKTIDKVFELHDENVERGIYDPKGVEWRGERNPDDLRPTKPREPMEMIDPIKIKNIDMGATKAEELMKAGIDIDKSKYTYSKYYDTKKKEYRVRVVDKSRKSKTNSEIDNVSLDAFNEMYK
tara:strand:+ start:41 stop:700 length:660 start_codon:yes stop_codon:yes gene_type:complete